VAVAAGRDHNLALKSDGTVGWGTNYFAQATPPAGMSGVVAIAAGLNHSLPLKSYGTVVGWGDSMVG
jgi:alpha-tubulin suppressor-like RCC1 family protein